MKEGIAKGVGTWRGLDTNKKVIIAVCAAIGASFFLCCGICGVFGVLLPKSQRTEADQASESDVATSEPAPTLPVEATSGKKGSASKQQDGPSADKPRKLGTMQEMGKAFYNGLAFADVAKGQELPNEKLTKDFCRSGQRTYRIISFDTNTFDASLREQMSSLGYPPTDPVYEKVKNVQYEVTRGEPKNVYDGDDRKMLPLLRIGASPGDEWDWDLGRQPNGDEVRYVFKYVRAVRFSGHDCVLIVCEDHANSGSLRNVTMQRIERWYAKRLGLVKADEYVSLGGSLTLLKAEHLVAE